MAGRITRMGGTVFLDEACIRRDRTLHVLEALRYADEVLLLITQTRKDPLDARSPPLFVDRRFVWLAIGAAFGRGIPIRGLLETISQKEFDDDPAIPVVFKHLEIFVTQDSYQAGLDRPALLNRIKAARQAAISQSGPRSRTCVFSANRSTSALARMEKRLKKTGITSCRWTPAMDADELDALAVLVDDTASEAWKIPELRGFLEDFVRREKPVVLVTPPGSQNPPDIPDSLDAASRVELRESDQLSLLQLLWAIVGYRRYDLQGTEFDVFISHSAKDELAVKELVNKFHSAGLRCWVDYEQVRLGENITDKIEDGLQRSRHIVVCLSKNLGNSNWCRREYGAILSRECSANAKRTVIPLKLDDCSDDDIPILLYDKRRAHVRNPSEMDELLTLLRGW